MKNYLLKEDPSPLTNLPLIYDEFENKESPNDPKSYFRYWVPKIGVDKTGLLAHKHFEDKESAILRLIKYYREIKKLERNVRTKNSLSNQATVHTLDKYTAKDNCILRFINGEINSKYLLILSPAGFGKTQYLISLLNERKITYSRIANLEDIPNMRKDTEYIIFDHSMFFSSKKSILTYCRLFDPTSQGGSFKVRYRNIIISGKYKFIILANNFNYEILSCNKFAARIHSCILLKPLFNLNLMENSTNEQKEAIITNYKKLLASVKNLSKEEITDKFLYKRGRSKPLIGVNEIYLPENII